MPAMHVVVESVRGRASRTVVATVAGAIGRTGWRSLAHHDCCPPLHASILHACSGGRPGEMAWRSIVGAAQDPHGWTRDGVNLPARANPPRNHANPPRDQTCQQNIPPHVQHQFCLLLNLNQHLFLVDFLHCFQQNLF
jgi:hypothetical protein